LQLPANWQTLFHNSEQMGIKVSSTVGTSTFNATANKIVNNDTQISVEIPAAGDATKAPSPVGPLAAKNTRGKIRVPKTADAADMTGSVMMLLGSLVAMGMIAGVTKKKRRLINIYTSLFKGNIYLK